MRERVDTQAQIGVDEAELRREAPRRAVECAGSRAVAHIERSRPQLAFDPCARRARKISDMAEHARAAETRVETAYRQAAFGACERAGEPHAAGRRPFSRQRLRQVDERRRFDVQVDGKGVAEPGSRDVRLRSGLRASDVDRDVDAVAVARGLRGEGEFHGLVVQHTLGLDHRCVGCRWAGAGAQLEPDVARGIAKREATVPDHEFVRIGPTRWRRRRCIGSPGRAVPGVQLQVEPRPLQVDPLDPRAIGPPVRRVGGDADALDRRQPR